MHVKIDKTKRMFRNAPNQLPGGRGIHVCSSVPQPVTYKSSVMRAGPTGSCINYFNGTITLIFWLPTSHTTRVGILQYFNDSLLMIKFNDFL